MSTPNDELRESIFDNFEETHPELWHEFRAGRATLGDIDDAIEEELQRLTDDENRTTGEADSQEPQGILFFL